MGARAGGRPRGEVRLALAQWARTAAADCSPQGYTFRDLVGFVPGMSPHSPADCHAVRLTLQAMAKAGELLRVGKVHVAGANRPATLFRPAPATPDDLGLQLQQAMQQLVRVIS